MQSPLPSHAFFVLECYTIKGRKKDKILSLIAAGSDFKKARPCGHYEIDASCGSVNAAYFNYLARNGWS